MAAERLSSVLPSKVMGCQLSPSSGHMWLSRFKYRIYWETANARKIDFSPNLLTTKRGQTASPHDSNGVCRPESCYEPCYGRVLHWAAWHVAAAPSTLTACACPRWAASCGNDSSQLTPVVALLQRYCLDSFLGTSLSLLVQERSPARPSLKRLCDRAAYETAKRLREHRHGGEFMCVGGLGCGMTMAPLHVHAYLLMHGVGMSI